MEPTVVSQLASYCAHCGHIEPSNEDEFLQSDCTIGLVYIHKESCITMENPIAHKAFVALWNAKTHMEMNDVLLSRAKESIDTAMNAFITKYLKHDSHYVLCTTEPKQLH